MTTMIEAYEEMERLLEGFRVEWAATMHIHGRKDNYWQGKKDGLRIGMNFLHGFIVDGWKLPDIINDQ